MARKENPGAAGTATGAGMALNAQAVGPRNVAQTFDAGTPYRVVPNDGEAFRIVVAGRDRWALDRLRRKGPNGCTPITEPAPRWSAYVFNLRALGVPIETIHEPHEGDYPGRHARYVLRAYVAPERKGGAA
jgi:hypothetical protein